MLLTLIADWWARHYLFQSSPDPEAGCYEAAYSRPASPFTFQSSPDPEAGCYEVCQMPRQMQYQFQSSPDPEAGCYPHTPFYQVT